MYLPFFDEYGLTREQVASNITNSYSELMIWNACKLAVCKGSAVHIVERAQEEINEKNGVYYQLLAKEFGFSSVSFSHLNGLTLSDGGISLESQGIALQGDAIPVVFNSILLA